MHSPITTRTGPPVAAPLTTLARVKSELGITDNLSDAFLAAAINQVSRGIAHYCNRSFAVQSWSDEFRGRGGSCWGASWSGGGRWDGVEPQSGPLVLAKFPLVAIQSVTETVGEVAAALTLGTDYEADPKTAELWRLDMLGNRRRWSADIVVVAYTAGFALTENFTLTPGFATDPSLSSLWFGTGPASLGDLGRPIGGAFSLGNLASAPANPLQLGSF